MAEVVIYGYHALALLFGTGHCLAVVCGECLPACLPAWLLAACGFVRN
jgi:hypothetical protein